jgi:hypothetical protein
MASRERGVPQRVRVAGRQAAGHSLGRRQPRSSRMRSVLRALDLSFLDALGENRDGREAEASTAKRCRCAGVSAASGSASSASTISSVLPSQGEHEGKLIRGGMKPFAHRVAARPSGTGGE